MKHTHRLRRTQHGWELDCLSDDGSPILTQQADSLESLLRFAGGGLPTPEDSVQLVYCYDDTENTK